MTSFPLGSSVLLQNLVNGAHLNDKKGIVKSRLDSSSSGRQEVYIFEANKSLSIKPENLRYEPRELSSLSISEMKGILRISKKIDVEPKEWSGAGKDELRVMVEEEVATDIHPVELAELVAKANEPKEIPSSASNSSSPYGSAQLRQGAERMSQMTPDGLRQQAATMKAMGPAALRNMNPQMARMTDAQINMAISQMEAVANNPSQLKMAADQMSKMSESELNQAVNQSPLVGSTASVAPTASSSAASTSTTPAINNISKSQFQQATTQMSAMSPDQLRQQAAMLKSMPLDTLRRTNPQMANMTDDQIKMSIQQVEQMAENPDMMKMATEQMKNMSESDYESMKQMMGGLNASGGGPSASATSSNATGSNAMAGLPTDPSKMMESLLQNPEQLNTIVKTMKSNPEMMKNLLGSQMGEGKSDAQKEQFSKAIDSFAQMDDVQLQRYLKVANGVQRVAKPVLTAFGKVKETLGLSTKALVILINLMLLACLVGLARWWKLRNGIELVGEDDILTSEEPPQSSAGYGDSEF